MLASHLLSTAPGELHLPVCGGSRSRNRNAVRIPSRAAPRSIRICCAKQNGDGGWLEPVVQVWWDRMSRNAGVLVGAAALCFVSGLSLPKSAKALVAPPHSAHGTPGKLMGSLNLPAEDRRRAIYQQKIGRIKEALEKDPGDQKAHSDLLQTFMAAGEIEKAIGLLGKLIKLHPQDLSLRDTKARCYHMIGRHHKARDEYKALVKMHPYWPRALHGLAFAMKRSEEPEFKVLQTIRDAVIDAKYHKQDRATKDFKLLLAQMLTLYDKSEEAMAVYEELVKDYPDDFRIYLCQGLLHDTLDNLDEARECFNKYKELRPQNACHCTIDKLLVSGTEATFTREDDEAIAPLLPTKVKEALAVLEAERAAAERAGEAATGESDAEAKAAAVASEAS